MELIDAGGAQMASDEVVGCEEADRLVAPIVLAFSTDPFVRWLLPASRQFLSFFPQITRLHARRTAAHCGAYLRSDRRRSATLLELAALAAYGCGAGLARVARARRAPSLFSD